MNYKKVERENKHFDQKGKIMESHIPYNCASTKSPHILITKWFYRLQKNCIVLKNPSETGRLKDRKIFYEVDSIGENIRYTNRGKYMNLLLENTKQNWVMIFVRYKEVMSNPKLYFFTESGDLIEEENLCLKEEGYVVLATIYRDKKLIIGVGDMVDHSLISSWHLARLG